MNTHKEKLDRIKQYFKDGDEVFGKSQVGILFEEISLLEKKTGAQQVEMGHLQNEIERLQAQLDAYHDYIRGNLTLGQLEAALNRIEPIYQQKPVQEWVGGSRDEKTGRTNIKSICPGDNLGSLA